VSQSCNDRIRNNVTIPRAAPKTPMRCIGEHRTKGRCTTQAAAPHPRRSGAGAQPTIEGLRRPQTRVSPDRRTGEFHIGGEVPLSLGDTAVLQGEITLPSHKARMPPLPALLPTAGLLIVGCLRRRKVPSAAFCTPSPRYSFLQHGSATMRTTLTIATPFTSNQAPRPEDGPAGIPPKGPTGAEESTRRVSARLIRMGSSRVIRNI